MSAKQSYDYKIVGILSDTHLTDMKECANLAEKLVTGPFNGVDAILHAGDHVCPDLAACFYPIPMISVRGNMDHRLMELPQYRILNINRYKVALIHGWGSPVGLEDRILSLFAGQSLDVIVYGHSHIPVCHHCKGTLMFNPGSPTDKRHSPIHSVGLIEFGSTVHGYHIDFNT